MTGICPHCGYDIAADVPVEIGEFGYDPRFGMTFRQKPIPITRQCHEIMASLLRADGSVLSIGALTDRLGSDSESNSLSVQVHRIRRALHEIGAPPVIATVRMRGYRWAAEACEAA